MPICEAFTVQNYLTFGLVYFGLYILSQLDRVIELLQHMDKKTTKVSVKILAFVVVVGFYCLVPRVLLWPIYIVKHILKNEI